MVEDEIEYNLTRRRGDLAAVEATGARGRCTTLRDIVLVARQLRTLRDHEVELTYFAILGEGDSEYVRRAVKAPFATAWQHTLDLPAWKPQGHGVYLPVDRSFAAHLKRMDARRASKAQQHKESECR